MAVVALHLAINCVETVIIVIRGWYVTIALDEALKELDRKQALIAFHEGELASLQFAIEAHRTMHEGAIAQKESAIKHLQNAYEHAVTLQCDSTMCVGLVESLQHESKKVKQLEIANTPSPSLLFPKRDSEVTCEELHVAISQRDVAIVERNAALEKLRACAQCEEDRCNYALQDKYDLLQDQYYALYYVNQQQLR